MRQQNAHAFVNCVNSLNDFSILSMARQNEKSHLKLVWVGVSTTGVFSFTETLYGKVLLSKNNFSENFSTIVNEQQYCNIDDVVIGMEKNSNTT